MLVLNYHRVGTPHPKARYRGMYVTPRLLAWQIGLLKFRGYRFETLTKAVKSGCQKNVCVLTFDDGYLDNYELGLPVLQSLQVPATVFVVTGSVGKSEVIWSEAGEQLPASLMSWEQLNELEKLGWEIGSHAADHVHLDQKPKAEQKHLIELSWAHFKASLGHTPTSFAYPYGKLNGHTLELLEALGCQAAVTTDDRGANTANTPPLLLYRKPCRGHHVLHAIKSFSLLIS